MSALDTFTEKFNQLLREIPADYTLPQWQFAYRKVLFSMGMKILERFPEDAVGPDPFATGGAGPGPHAPDKNAGQAYPAGQGPGTHPHCIGDLVEYVLCIHPHTPKTPPIPKP